MNFYFIKLAHYKVSGFLKFNIHIWGIIFFQKLPI